MSIELVVVEACADATDAETDEKLEERDEDFEELLMHSVSFGASEAVNKWSRKTL